MIDYFFSLDMILRNYKTADLLTHMICQVICPILLEDEENQ